VVSEVRSQVSGRRSPKRALDGGLRSFLLCPVFSLIDRYIAKSYIGFLILGIVVFLTLFLVIDFMTSLSRFDVPLSTLSSYYTVYIFEILYQLLPVASLVGVVFTLSSLNRTRELTALYSLGMGLRRVVTPIFVIILLLVIFSFYLGDKVLPITKKKRDYIYYVQMKKNPGLYATVKTDKIWYRTDNIIFNIKALDGPNKQAFGVTLYYFSPNWKLEQLIFAQKAKIKNGAWVLEKGNTTLFVDDFSTPLSKTFETKSIVMNQELSDIQATSLASESLSFNELGRYIEKNKSAGLDMTSFEVDYHSKLSFPFTILVMSLLGVPFVVAHERSGGGTKNIGLVMVMTFAYWTLLTSGLALGKHGDVPPVVAAWGPNVIILLLTLVFFRMRRA